ncbi:hypothetical protein LTR36_005285 [Oleoguttula mirabilis]|uniref:Uncharacterized protein n=1 Tax=Oleoguttula mirabilis TaxID=1507867 RepID=A0AAV9JF28_9PEZI|nr:hypothetical protein LTR36_005285 [Oleoguttula mirabilis]
MHEICPPPEGYDGCELCKNHFRSIEQQEQQNREGKTYRYEQNLSDQEASALIAVLREQNEDDREYVTARLQTHGGLILNRWTKKSKEKRAVMFSTCLPGVFGDWPRPSRQKMLAELAEMQLLDDDTARQAVAELPWLQQRYSTVMFPFAEWLKLEDFIEDCMRLLSLLHARTQYTPAAWALFDTRSSMLQFCAGLLPTVRLFNANSVKLYGEEYGALTAEWNHCLALHGAILGFPRAYCTFVAQASIMDVLRQLVDIIVVDTEPSGNAMWMALVNSAFRGSGCEALWGAYTNQPFTAPQQFDLRTIHQKAKVRLDLVLDEVELMQTVLAYMHHVVRQMKAGIVFDEANGVQADTRYKRLATDLVVHDIRTRMATWRIVVQECEDTAQVFEAYRDRIAPGEPLPREVDIPLCSIGGMLESRRQKLGLVFDRLLPRMRPLTHRITHYQQGGTVRFRENETMDPESQADRVYWSLTRARRALQSNNFAGASRWFDQLEREMLVSTPASLVDKRFYHQLSDLTAMEEIRTMWLWSQHYNTEVSMTDLRTYWAEVFPGHEAPWPKGRKGLAWLEKATVCRERLADLWGVVRDVLRGLEEQAGKREDLIDDWMSCFSFDTQPEYFAEVKQERLECEAEISAAALASSLQSPNVETEQQTEWGNGDTPTLPMRRKQTKAKAARNLEVDPASDGGLQAEATDSEMEPPQQQTPIPVKQDSLAVFHRMYPATGANSTQGAVRWIQFAQAMCDAGFTATAATGSAVNFSNASISHILSLPSVCISWWHNLFGT